MCRNQSIQDVESSVDRFYLVYWILTLLGLANLLPFNVFISQPEYFAVRTHQVPTVPWLADGIETSIVIAFQLMNCCALVAIIPYVDRLSEQQLVTVPLWMTVGVMAVSAAGAALTSLSGRVMLVLVLGSSGLMGITTALLQSGVFNVAAHLPPLYMQAVTIGMAVAGLAVSALSGITLWAGAGATSAPTAADLRAEAIAYFAGSAVVVAIALCGYHLLRLLPFWRFQLELRGSEIASEEILEALVESPEEGPDWQTTPARMASDGVRFLPTEERPPPADEPLGAEPGKPRLGPAGHSRRPPLWTVLRFVQWHCLALTLCFLVTLTAFPALTSVSCSSRSALSATGCQYNPLEPRLYGNLWIPLLFVMFNGGDVLGRILAGIGPGHVKGFSGPVLVAYSAARVLLLLGMAVCRIATPHAWRLPLLLRADIFPVLLNLFFGITNGHLATVTSMHLPSLLPRHLRGSCGPVMAGAMTLGLTVGSMLSFLLMALLQAS